MTWLESTMVDIDQNKRVSLSERKFQGFWKNTDKSLKEKTRPDYGENPGRVMVPILGLIIYATDYQDMA